MKTILLVLLLSFSAEASLKTSVAELMTIKNEINDLLSDNDPHYYLFFSDQYRGNGPRVAKKCQYASEYQKLSLDKLTESIVPIFKRSVKYLEGDIVAKAQNGVNHLLKSLRGAKLSVCHESSVPPYSDGQELFYVKVNDRLNFIYGYGFPD